MTIERIDKLDGSMIIDSVAAKLGTDKFGHIRKCMDVIVHNIEQFGFPSYLFNAIKASD